MTTWRITRTEPRRFGAGFGSVGCCVVAFTLAGSAFAGCSADESLAGTGAMGKPSKPARAADEPAGASEDGGVVDDDLPGRGLTIEVHREQPTYVELGTPSVAQAADGTPPGKWDLVFRSLEIFTNGGSSGKGVAAAFGPGDPLNFLFTEAPAVPFLRSDRAGGAFLQWYAYEGAGHSLWSRQHVYGVRSGDRYWKVQILGYYGEQLGAPVSALYQLRYAAVGDGEQGETVLISDLDATAGGTVADEGAKSGCLNLLTGEQLALTLPEAKVRDDWHLCFLRDAISVNNAPTGPGDVVAVDLDQELTATESIEQVQSLTPEAARPRFDGVDYATLEDPELDYIQDGVVSAFGERWYERDGDRILAKDASWFVRSYDARHYYLVIFRSVEPLADGGYRIEMRVREVE